MQVVCSPGCAHPYVRHRDALKFKAETRKRRRELNQSDRRWWIKQAQTVFNAYIRERDKGKPCISCGRFHQGKYDAGHYRPAGNNSALRFHEENTFAQCVPCNQHKSGNLVEYRINLIKRIGPERVEWLENHQQTKRWTIDELREVVEYYRAKIRDLKHDHGIV
jgi:hypothetical protein